MPRHFSVDGGAARLVHDADYADVAAGLARAALDRLWCSVFIVDLAPHDEAAPRVRELVRALAAARWRGVDVRAIVGGSRTNRPIAEAVAASLLVLRAHGVPARGLSGDDVRGSHVKLVLADDRVLTGSHNWSPGALGGQVQDGVLIESADLASALAGEFLWQWRRAR